jgi:hypothetical protein
VLSEVSSTKYNENSFSRSRVVTLDRQTDMLLLYNLLCAGQGKGKLSPVSKHRDVEACRQRAGTDSLILHLQFRSACSGSPPVTHPLYKTGGAAAPASVWTRLVPKIHCSEGATRRAPSQSTASHYTFYFYCSFRLRKNALGICSEVVWRFTTSNKESFGLLKRN